MTRIIEILGFVCQGVTEPVFCRAEDGYEYVVKGNYAGRRALIAEWVAGRLGRLLGLPIPECELLALDPLLVEYSIQKREVAHLGRGTLFGSRRVLNVVEVRSADLPLIELPLRAKVLAFDWWISNPDRNWSEDAGNPNLLWCEEPQKLVVMDHNLAFSPSRMTTFWDDHVFREARLAWSQAFCDAMSASFGKALGELANIWAELPDDWVELEGELTIEVIDGMLRKFIGSPEAFWGFR